MIRSSYYFQCCLVLVVAVFLSCQNRPQRIGMPQHFSGKIPDTLTVMSYNVENLFDMTDNGGEYPEFKPNACNWTANTYTAKLTNISSVIAAVNPQVAVLVEVENEKAVLDLCKACSDHGCGFPYFAIGDPKSGSNTRPVVLSKLPVLWEKSFGIIPGAPHERPMLEAAVYCGRDTVLVFACHWPSKKNPESFRIERARLLKSRLDALADSQEYIVAGDFNENFDESETFRTAGFDDTQGKTGINHVLGTMISRPGQGARYVRPQELASIAHAQGLFDPWCAVPERERFSEAFEGRRETPDHMLLPASLFDGRGISYVNNSFAPFTWNGRLLKDGVPLRWQMRYANHERIHVGDGFSDHVPIVLKLVRAPYRADTAATDASGERGTVPQGGFEDGADGFLAATKKILVERDTLMPKSGRYCLRLTGETKSSGCAVRARLFIPEQCGTEAGVLSLCLRGTGTLGLRCRAPGEKKWAYFVGPAFSQARAGKYTDYNFTKWRTTRLPLSALPKDLGEIEFEIRTKKDSALDLRIDDVKVVCRE
jgi:hypothetical protein